MIKTKQTKSEFNKFYKNYWFIIWFFIYGILYYVSSLLTNIIGITNYYFQAIFIGLLISIIARIISSKIHLSKFKLNFSLVIWTLIYICLIFLIKHIFSLFVINYWLSLIILSILIVIFVQLLKKIPFTFLSAVVIIIVLIFGFFIYDAQYSTLNNNSDSNSVINSNKSDTITKESESLNNIDVLCTWRVYETIGTHYAIKYGVPRNYDSDSARYIVYYINDFTNANFVDLETYLREAENTIFVTLPPNLETENLDPLYSKSKVLKNTVRLGYLVGERADWIYGEYEIQYNYLKEKVLDPDNTILGNNSFEIIVKIDDFSTYNTEQIIQSGERYLFFPAIDVIEIKKCNFVDTHLLEKRIDNLILSNTSPEHILPFNHTPEMIQYLIDRYAYLQNNKSK